MPGREPGIHYTFHECLLHKYLLSTLPLESYFHTQHTPSVSFSVTLPLSHHHYNKYLITIGSHIALGSRVIQHIFLTLP